MNQYIVVMGLPVAQRLHVGPKREEIAFYLQARERCRKEHLENGGTEASVPVDEALWEFCAGLDPTRTTSVDFRTQEAGESTRMGGGGGTGTDRRSKRLLPEEAQGDNNLQGLDRTQDDFSSDNDEGDEHEEDDEDYRGDENVVIPRRSYSRNKNDNVYNNKSKHNRELWVRSRGRVFEQRARRVGT